MSEKVKIKVTHNVVHLPAIALYERFGFARMDIRDLGYDPDSDELFCLYQKLLG